MYFDLDLPFPTATAHSQTQSSSQSKKQKQKQKQGQQLADTVPCLTVSERQVLENKIDTLVHLGYTVIAVNFIVQSKYDPGTHQCPKLDLRPRDGVAILKRLTIVLDEGSEKGFGLTNNNLSTLSQFDLLSLRPTTLATFSLACLSHTVPGPLTAHIISLDLASQPRLPFHLKRTLVRTALRNGAVFEIGYAPAVTPGEENRRRNWWANAREVGRVTEGKGVIVSSGGGVAELRAPRDVINLVSILGLNQNVAHDTVTTTPKSLVLRSQTRKTYRAVLSEPKLIMPKGAAASEEAPQVDVETKVAVDERSAEKTPEPTLSVHSESQAAVGKEKRAMDKEDEAGPRRKKKKKA
ncbi:hypothetical protein BOTBODRAFT_37216 [Botryobasidium botryosum FD-172 SS1]|uniref:PHP domain-like protein n=1 Tax=Botryobasidium botryosum (strain FD-172 SS1) TaxID=930990 RepID=A0A067M176_BOTB1|nr:hypothetical protein BOTBODRAFT_37216 [Botryobasidium botryosum FD-172 SS1]